MTFLAKLLAAALSLPLPWHAPGTNPETPVERRERVETIVEAIVAETAEPPEAWPWPAPDLAYAVLVKTWYESGRWRLEVHRGSKTGDGGKARCLGQLHQSSLVSREEWLGSVGTDAASTRLCVRLVARVLAFHAARCRVGRRPSTRRLAAILAGYGTGGSCDPNHVSPHLGKAWALKRARLWERLRSPPWTVLH